MNRKWTYTGNIDSHACQKNYEGKTIITEIQLGDLYDSNKAPVLLHCGAGLFGYIFDVEGHDDEERYMKKEFLYDDILVLREIRVLNDKGEVCKIIRDLEDFNWTGKIIGPRERINDRNQQALAWNAENDLQQVHYVGPDSFKN